MPFEFRRHDEIRDVIIVQPRSFGDGRGWFEETYKRSEFERAGIRADFRQDNHSRSTVRGVLRGLHYQKKPAAQGKLVRCCVGAIFDVAVDIRRGSPTYGKWIGMELTAENRTILWIPEGFAHAVCTLTDIAEVLYKATGEYSPQEDRAIRWNDPALNIRWPVNEPVLSPKDATAPTLEQADNNFTWKAES
jgi:dTDP-4-dehydrorhamnose 3,5-epimerase